MALLGLVACAITYGMLDKMEKDAKKRTVVIWSNSDGRGIPEEEVA